MKNESDVLRGWRIGETRVFHIVRHHHPGPARGVCIGLLGHHGHYARLIVETDDQEEPPRHD